MSVYIEDTDAYGVIYNSNYLRAYERALQIYFQTTANDDEWNGTEEEEEAAAWTVLQVDEQKFKSSPPLGGTFVIQATQCIADREDALDGTQVWGMQMKKYPKDDNDKDDPAVVYNSAKVTIGKGGVAREKLPASIAGSGTKTTTRPTATTTTTENYNYLLYRDEFDPHLTTHMPLRNVLNLFERSRTNYLGGPDMLRAFQVEHQIVFVVTRVDQCCLVFGPLPPPPPPLFEDGQGNKTGGRCIMARPGQTGTVQTEFLAKRKGMILECHQSLWVEDRCVAQGIVTIMSLNEATRRPTANFPPWFQAKVGL
jgi:acyl-CoA thioesterase FadM